MDTIIGKAHRQAPITLNEHQSMYTHDCSCKRTQSKAVAKAVALLLSDFKSVHAYGHLE